MTNVFWRYLQSSHDLAWNPFYHFAYSFGDLRWHSYPVTFSPRVAVLLETAKVLRELPKAPNDIARIIALLLPIFPARVPPADAQRISYEGALAIDAAIMGGKVPEFGPTLNKVTRGEFADPGTRAKFLMFLDVASSRLPVLRSLKNTAPEIAESLAVHDIAVPGSPKLESISLKDVMDFVTRNREKILWIPVGSSSMAASGQLIQGDYVGAL